MAPAGTRARLYPRGKDFDDAESFRIGRNGRRAKEEPMMTSSEPAPGAKTPAEILRRYIDHDRDIVLGLTANMPPDTQAEYLQIHDEALAALATLASADERPERASSARLTEHLRETGGTWAIKLFRDETSSPAEIWAAATNPVPMLALLDAVRPLRYASGLRQFMLAALALVRSLDLGDNTLLFTPALEEALALATARARGEIALSELPKVKTLRRTVSAESDSPEAARALTLVVDVVAENVTWGVKTLSARVSDYGYQAFMTTATADQDAARGDGTVPVSVLLAETEAARAAGEQGRHLMEARLAGLLREQFPNPFA
jgi:hypothetical protein